LTSQEKDKETDSDKDDSEDKASRNAGPSANANTFGWHNSGEHPKMGWVLNDSLTLGYYKIYILDFTTSTHTLIVALYVSYSIQPNQAEVSATYGKGYPTLTCVLTPTQTKYLCPSATSNQLTLLMETPYAKAVTKVIETYFPVHLQAAFKQYQHFQEQKYHA